VLTETDTSIYWGRDVAKSLRNHNMNKEIAANFEAFFEIDTAKSG